MLVSELLNVLDKDIHYVIYVYDKNDMICLVFDSSDVFKLHRYYLSYKVDIIGLSKSNYLEIYIKNETV